MYLIARVCVLGPERETDIPLVLTVCMSVCESEMFVFVLGPNPAFILNADYYPGGIAVFPS